MKDRFDVDLRVGASALEVLNKITAATEREKLPFISASRYPRQREKEFVSKVAGNRFRIWKVPSSSKSRQNVCIPYLHGMVKDVNPGSSLMGSFALHPFNKLLAVLPLAVVVLLWLWTEKTAQSITVLVVFSAFFLCIEIAMILAAKRLRPKEEKDIVEFLSSLFPEAHPSSAREPMVPVP
jgi:hypothetical protein